MPGKGINITDPTAFYESSTTNITLVVMTREVSFFFTFLHFRYYILHITVIMFVAPLYKLNDKYTILLKVCH